jgi:ankyrin repeat protein
MLTLYKLHNLVKQGNLPRVRDLLNASPPEDINAYDDVGHTPLMHAAKSPKANVDLMRLLLDRGANVHLESRAPSEANRSVISLCIGDGDPLKVTALIESGADIHYSRDYGYDALLDAVYGRDVVRDPRLIDLVKLLIANGVELNNASSYDEMAFRVLSHLGRFDAVRLLLDASADATLLKWTPLIRAVALGSLADVVKTVESKPNLEEKDHAKRTAWLVAVQTGNVAKARFLLEHGADATMRGHCGKPSLFYAIENHHGPMLNWLLEIGTPVEQIDDFETTALMAAVQCGNAKALDALLKAGADIDVERNGQTALAFVEGRELALRLLNAGADPQQLPFEGRRALLGLDPEPDEALLNVSPSEFLKGRSRRFGAGNPEKMFEPFWEGMIRAGIDAYRGAARYGHGAEVFRPPVWCAQRFGQSITLLPDGRVVQIAGEHEDSYDPDFCIYNDVFVHEPDGTIHIFGYPESVFPPTDFHTATLVDEHIFLMGSLGYQGTRRYGETPVYRLDIATFRIEQIQAGGEAPGWIYKHRAMQSSAHEIRISGGTVVVGEGGGEMNTDNEESFIFDTERLIWRAER